MFEQPGDGGWGPPRSRLRQVAAASGLRQPAAKAGHLPPAARTSIMRRMTGVVRMDWVCVVPYHGALDIGNICLSNNEDLEICC
jgi:hypothetical protein